jgi:P4 family phage/plasmid primase-like protien
MEGSRLASIVFPDPGGPISNRLCNAFDMVRLHLFGSLDEGSTEDIGNLPSVREMKKLCQTDDLVRAELAEGVLQTPESVFDKKADLESFKGDLTEIGLSVLMADTYGYGVMRNRSFGWMFWDGTRWLLDADAEAALLMMQFTDELYRSAQAKLALASTKAELEQAKREFSAVCRLRTAPGISHLTNILKSIANEPRTDSFDADPWALNTPDGIIDLRTGELGPHDPKARCTKCTAVSPGSLGAAQWMDFIDHITGGDEDFAQYLQTLAGMAAVGKVYEEGLVISYGKGGNGKSTFFGVLKSVFGDYAKAINADVLAPSPGSRPDQSYIAALRGVRLAVLGETEESAYMSNAQLKRITSRDVISARALYKDPMEFIPTHTTIMHTNHLPRLGSMDGGTKRRIAIAPFPSTLPPDQVITDYQGVLFKECGPSVLQWVVDGAVRFYEGGCKLPMARCVKKATGEYLSGEDWFNTFVTDVCEVVVLSVDVVVFLSVPSSSLVLVVCRSVEESSSVRSSVLTMRYCL